MGSSQSKRNQQAKMSVLQRRQIEQDSILAAIATNKRQRKLLLKQARLINQATANHQYQSQEALMLCQPPRQPRHHLQSTQNYSHNPSVYPPQTNGSPYGQVAQLYEDDGDDNVNGAGYDENYYNHDAYGNAYTTDNVYPGTVNMNAGAYDASYRYGHGLASRHNLSESSLGGIGSENTNINLTNGVLFNRHYKREQRQQPHSQQQQQQQKQRKTTTRKKYQSSKVNTTTPIIDATMPATLIASRQLSRETLEIGSKVVGGGGGLQRHHQRTPLSHYDTLAIGSQSSTSQYSSQSSSSSSSTNYTIPENHNKQTTAASIKTTTTATQQARSGNNNKTNKKNHHHYLANLAANSSSVGGNTAAAVNNSGQQGNQYRSNYRQMFIQSRYQRGLAYTNEERSRYGLLGLLPAAVQDQDMQVRAVINFIDNCKDELSKYVYLRHLKDFNERLFYAALTQNVEKLMPLVYTPTVGLACQKFSEIYTIPRGLFITANDAGRVPSLLANWPETDVRVIVVTDGERILGLGDLGANGMGISIGKLSLYTALAGIPPQNVLPITIDVGTNNETFLKDPFYIGLRQNRVRGAKYDSLIEEFMLAVVERWGRSCLIQFEDFANSTAFELLQRYRNKYCTFNDDIQGTASVCLSGLISAAKLTGRRLADCSFLFYGAGEANLGTAHLLTMAMMEEGAPSEAEAKSRIWLVDSKGLVVSSRTDLSSHKRAFAQVNSPQIKDLEEIIGHAKPVAIIGASAQGGAFTDSICKKMASFNERPIIFALSNPTSKAECTADQAYKWTNGKCVFASGSPFDPVVYNGKTYITGQGNNAYIFPGVGLAAIAAHIHTIPEDTFLVAARALSDQLTAGDTSVGLVYPSLTKIREVTLRVATRVLEHFYSERLATYRPEPEDKMSFLKSIQFQTQYDDSELPTLSQMSLARANGNSHHH